MRGSLRFLFVLFPILGMVAPLSFSTTITLHPGQSIQAAIDSATDGDEIVLSRGIYNGGISFRGKGVTVRSEEPLTRSVVLGTLIVEPATSETILFTQGEGPLSILSGIYLVPGSFSHSTIRIVSSSPVIEHCILGGTGNYTGVGGISCVSSSPVIRECVFRSIVGSVAGVIGLSTNSHPVISDCYFYRNQSYDDGGCIHIGAGCSATVERCEFEENRADHGAAILSSGTGTRIQNCIFRNNLNGFGPAIHCWNDRDTVITNSIFTSSSSSQVPELAPILCENSSPVFENCTIAFNRASSQVAGVMASDGTRPVFRNCILWNQGEEFSGGGKPIVEFCCVEGGYRGETSFDFNPGFADDPNYLLALRSDSLCIDAGDPETSFNDACLPPGKGTSLNDIGAYGGPGNCLWEDYVALRDPTATPTMTETFSPTPTITHTPTPSPTNRGFVYEVHPGERIGTAILNSVNGDVIIIYPGVYREQIYIYKKNLTIRSINPDDPMVVLETIIDGGGIESALVIKDTREYPTIIEGLSFIKGSRDRGAGVLIESSSATLRNCRIFKNIWGGTIYGGMEKGGGIKVWGSNVQIIGCHVSENFSESGGGLYLANSSSAEVYDCTYTMNSANTGGAIFLESGTSLMMRGCILSDNNGNDAGGVLVRSNSIASFQDVKFLHNNGINGAGAIQIYGDLSYDFLRCEFRGNTSKIGAGALYAGNKTQIHFHQVSVASNWSEKGYGGVFLDYGSQIELIGSTIAGNRSQKGAGGISTWEGSIAKVVAQGCIFWNEGQDLFQITNADITHCCVKDGWPGEGNTSNDPRFVEEGDYRLTLDSPFIDSAVVMDATLDLVGNPRPYDAPGVGRDGTGDEYDLGAYEYPREGNIPYTPTITPTLTHSHTPTNTFTITSTPTVTETITLSPTRTQTPTPAPIRSVPIVYVSSIADATQDGKSWQSAYRTVQAAIDSATGAVDIWIRGGYYQEYATLKSEVALYGGFKGNEDESEFDLRNLVANQTKVEGLYVYNAEGVILDGLSMVMAEIPMWSYVYDGELCYWDYYPTKSGCFDAFQSSIFCDNCVIEGIWIPQSYYGRNVWLEGCTFYYINNDGGGAHITNSLVIFNNSIFLNNAASGDGGGLLARGDSDVSLHHCIMMGNDPYAVAVHDIASINVVNSILYGKIGEKDGGIISVEFSITDIYYDGPGNICADPLVIDVTHGNFHLLPNSPCIDAGVNKGVTVDFEGNPRPIDVPGVGADGTGEEYDMGPYEFVPPSPTVTPSPTITETPTITMTTSPTETPTATGTPTVTETATVTPLDTDTPTLTFTPTDTATPTPSMTSTGTATVTGTPTQTETSTPSVTLTQTETPTITPVPTTTCTPTPVPTIPGDVTQDETVDAGDVMKILGAWHEEVGSASPEDINQDGGLDLLDLAILLQHWHVETGP